MADIFRKINFEKINFPEKMPCHPNNFQHIENYSLAVCSNCSLEKNAFKSSKSAL